MNSLLTQIQFGIKRFKSFRKKLVLDYKWGGKHAHKNTHAIPLKLKQKLLNVNVVLNSPRKAETGEPFESWKGKAWLLSVGLRNMVNCFAYVGFVFQKDKLPVYNIPNIDGFELLPYVEYMAPLLKEELL